MTKWASFHGHLNFKINDKTSGSLIILSVKKERSDTQEKYLITRKSRIGNRGNQPKNNSLEYLCNTVFLKTNEKKNVQKQSYRKQTS